MNVHLDLERTMGGYIYILVNPDIAIFGKALGNGYAITAIIEENIRKLLKIVSLGTWTEKIGPAAALETLSENEKIKIAIIDSNGKYIIKNWINLAKKYDLDIKISGLPALCSFKFNAENENKYKALITQELLKKVSVFQYSILLYLSY